MSPYQKIAWFNLAVIALTVAVFLALIPFVGIERAKVAFILLILLAFGFVMLATERGRTIHDERDINLDRKAKVATFYVFIIYFISGSLYLGCFTGNDLIPRQVIINFSVIGNLVFLVAYSISILVLYDKEQILTDD
ncbi:MAG TPA: hypothetical protein VM123_06140 [archaeon]|nr:hypothetical protein [archaeon]